MEAGSDGAERIITILDDVLGPPEKRNKKQIELFAAVLGDELDFRGTWEFILFGGAGGGGKSYGMRWAAVLFLLLAFKLFSLRDVRVGLFCEDYDALRDRQISKIATEFPEWLGRIGKYQDIGLAFRLAPQLGSGFIALRNLDKPQKYHSSEFAAAFVDEFTQNKNAADIFDELRFRLRWPGFPDWFKFPFVAGTNPGGPGHGVAKDLWVDNELPAELKGKAKEFRFIQAFATDNHYLSPKYYKDLLSLPEDLREAYAFGNWNVFKGQYFKEWRKAVHVVPEFRIPHYWTRFTVEDWGYDAPWCRIWFAISPEGSVIAYREQYERHRLPEYMAAEGKRLSEGEKISYKLGDPAMWQSAPQGHGGYSGPPIAEQLQANGWMITKGDNRRIAGWQQVRSYLSHERDAEGNIKRAPKFQVMAETCPNLIRTLPVQVYDKFNVEDLDTDGEDHAADVVRMALMSRPKLTIVPLEEMADEYAEAALRMAHAESKRKRVYA